MRRIVFVLPFVIRDADGTEVYDEVQVPSPNEQTAVGTTDE